MTYYQLLWPWDSVSKVFSVIKGLCDQTIAISAYGEVVLSSNKSVNFYVDIGKYHNFWSSFVTFSILGYRLNQL